MRGPLTCFEILYALYMDGLYECSSAVKVSISKSILNVLEQKKRGEGNIAVSKG